MIAFWRYGSDAFDEPTFTLSVADEEKRKGSVEWTKRAIEDGAQISDYAESQPEEYSLSGKLSPSIPGQTYDRQAVIDADETIRAMMKERQVVTLVTSWWTPTNAVIKSIESSMSHNDGDELKLSLELQTVEIVKPQFTKMPPERLRNKKRGSNKGKGGTTDPKADTKTKAKSKTAMARLYDALGGGR